MNDYYLLALNEEHPRIISISIDGVDLSHTYLKDIDFTTSKFSMDSIKKDLLSKGIIDNMDTPIVIAHQKKYNDKIYINMYELITSDNDKYSIHNYTDNNKIKVKDVESLLKSFFNKQRKKDSNFKDYTNEIFSDINSHSLTRLKIIYANLFDKDKKDSTLNDKVSYSEIRKLICALDYYDKYPIFNDYLDRINRLSEYTIKHYEELSFITNSNNINGQIKFDDYIKSNNSEKHKYNSVSEMENDDMDYLDIYANIIYTPWDDPKMSKYFEKDFNGKIPNEAFSMSLDDKARARLIDALEYKYAKIDEYNNRIRNQRQNTDKTDKDEEELIEKEEFFEKNEIEDMGYSNNDIKSL